MSDPQATDRRFRLVHDALSQLDHRQDNLQGQVQQVDQKVDSLSRQLAETREDIATNAAENDRHSIILTDEIGKLKSAVESFSNTRLNSRTTIIVALIGLVGTTLGILSQFNHRDNEQRSQENRQLIEELIKLEKQRGETIEITPQDQPTKDPFQP